LPVTILVLWNGLLPVWPEIPFSSFTLVLYQHCGNERDMHECVSGGGFLSPSLQHSELCPFYVNFKERGVFFFRNSCNVLIRGVYERSLCFLTVLWQSKLLYTDILHNIHSSAVILTMNGVDWRIVQPLHKIKECLIFLMQ
jgi:hypothetical protein